MSMDRSKALARTEREFLARLAELSATPLYSEWLGVLTRYKVRCSAGHECWPLPASMKQGAGICRTCAGNDPRVAEVKFLARLADLGATPLYVKWMGVMHPHQIECRLGHVSKVRPLDVSHQSGICRTCTGNSPERGESKFRKRLTLVGATPTYRKWLGAQTPHRVRCSNGHTCWPRPNNLRHAGPCRICAGKTWDVFYVVTTCVDARTKIGVTSHDAQNRLGVHRRNGYTDVRFIGRTVGADVLEREVLDTLAAHNIQPVRGREYFDTDLALDIILGVVAAWTTDGRLLPDAAHKLSA